MQLVRLIMLGLMQRIFHQELSRDCFVTLHNSLVIPHLEYANIVWAPRKIRDIEKIEKVQKRLLK